MYLGLWCYILMWEFLWGCHWWTSLKFYRKQIFLYLVTQNFPMHLLQVCWPRELSPLNVNLECWIIWPSVDAFHWVDIYLCLLINGDLINLHEDNFIPLGNITLIRVLFGLFVIHSGWFWLLLSFVLLCVTSFSEKIDYLMFNYLMLLL